MNIEFTQNTKGFSATIKGIQSDTVIQKVNACKEGNCSCECDPAVMDKIENIDVTSAHGSTTISITGDVSSQTLAPMMQSCLTQKDKS